MRFSCLKSLPIPREPTSGFLAAVIVLWIVSWGGLLFVASISDSLETRNPAMTAFVIAFGAATVQLLADGMTCPSRRSSFRPHARRNMRSHPG